MPKTLLDSDVLIYALRGNEKVLTDLKSLSEEEVPAISALTYFEIWVGVRPKEEKGVSLLLHSLSIIPVDQQISKEAAEYVKHFRSRGITLGTIDSLIAATAKVHQLALATFNVDDYPMKDIRMRSFD